MLTLLVTSMLTLTFNIQPAKGEPTTWTVDDDGPADFHTIQEAINAANPGDTIYVHSGTYYEHLIIRKNNLTFVGEEKSNTKIDGSLTGETVVIGADSISFKGFTIWNNDFGIVLGYWYPLYYSSHYSTISENIITNSLRSGILLLGSYNNVISNNVITDNGGHGVGLCVQSSRNEISNNTVSNNGHSGIRLDPLTKNNKVCGNTFVDNTYGINVYAASENIIYRNNLINNAYQVYSYDSLNIWDDGYPSGGNYWSDYGERYPSAQELDDSGIWDTPYVIDGNNKDNYPLMEPWSPTPETVRVSVLIDYGNGTRTLHADVTLPAGSPVLNATLAVARVDYISYGELGVFVDAINDVWNSYPYWWIWWYWDPVESTWMLGPVASNQYALSNGEIIAWYYESIEIWPLPQPPWTPIEPVVTATADIDPDTLNLRSKGRWITAYVQLPEGYSAADINATTILLNGTISPILDPKYGFVTNSSEYLVDHDNDGTLERMVKFDRATLASWIYQSAGMQYDVSLTITGELLDGTPFEGTDTISAFWTGKRSPCKR